MAQRVVHRIPEQMEIPERSIYLSNPAGIEARPHRVEASSGYKGFTGFRNVLKYVYGGFLYTTGSDTLTRRRHTMGITLSSEREGEFIQRNYIYGLYSLPITIGKKLTVVGGVSLGLASYSLTGTSVVAGGTATGPDGKIGISVYTRAFSAGIASGGIFNTELQPLYEKNVLQRYYVSHLRGNVSPHPDWKFSGIGIFRFSTIQRELFLGTRFHYRKIFEGGFSIKYNTSLSYLIGLPVLKLSAKSNLALFVSYSSVFKKAFYGNSDIFEVNIGYFFN